MGSFAVGIPTQCVPDLHFLPELRNIFLGLCQWMIRQSPNAMKVCQGHVGCDGSGLEWSLEVNLDSTWIPTSRCSVNLTCLGLNLVFAVRKSL